MEQGVAEQGAQGCHKISGLILFDNVVIPFVDKYPTDTKTYAIMNTKPEESVKKEDEVS